MWHKIPPIRCLRAFDAVIRNKGITHAAKEENVSQSAISQSVNQLEEFVQAKLLDRSSRPVSQTEQGRRFHRVICEAFDQVTQEVEELRARGRQPSNSITVSCNLGFATYWLMPRLNEFNQKFPDVVLNVMTTYQGDADMHPDADVAVRFGDGEWPDGTGQLLFEETLIPACSPDYLDRHGRIESPEALIGHPLIFVNATDPSWHDWSQYLKHFGITGTKNPAGARFNNYVLAVQAALAGDGIMLGWRSVIGDLVATRQLVAAVNAPVKLTSGYYLLTSPRVRGRAVEKFVEWLHKAAKEVPDIIEA